MSLTFGYVESVSTRTLKSSSSGSSLSMSFGSTSYAESLKLVAEVMFSVRSTFWWPEEPPFWDHREKSSFLSARE